MDSRNQKLGILKKNFEGGKSERFGRKLDSVSLRDIPLEIRRKEAKKPLFLIRYE